MTPQDLQPGVPVQLDAHVTRIVAPNGGVMTGAGTNTYLVGAAARSGSATSAGAAGPGELIVIDPGPDDESHMQAILEAAAGRPVRWILCTHTHTDHAPGAPRLRELTGATVGAMAAPLTDHDYQLVPDRVLVPGEVIDRGAVSLRAIHTPGHASNHVCFLLSSNGMLFTGDHIMQGSTVVIWPPDGNMRAYLESLRRLLDLEIRSLAPGHGYLIQDPHEEVTRLIRHRLRREEKVRQALLQAGKGATLEELLPVAYDDVSQVLLRMAARSLQAHLDKLLEDGEVRCVAGSYFVA